MSPPALAGLLDLIDAVFAVNGALLQEGDRLGEGGGITSAQWQVLGLLEHGPDTVASIARRRGLRRQSVQETANRLVRAGLARRSDNPKDRRAPILVITARGAAALTTVEAARDAWLHQLAQGFTPREVETTVHVLTQLRARLGVPLRDTPHRGGHAQ